MRQRTIALVGVVCAALVVSAGLVTALGSPAQQQQLSSTAEQEASRTISVTASGTATTSPGQVQVRVSVVSTNESAQAARQNLSESVDRMRSALTDIGISTDQIRTTEYTIEYDDERLHYRGEHAFLVTVEDLDTAGQVIDTAVTNGADRIDDVRFTLTPAQRQSLRTQALKQAMSNSRRQATTIANASQLTITGVYSVRKTTSVDRPGLEVTRATLAGGGTDLEGGPIGVRMTVHVTYNATAG